MIKNLICLWVYKKVCALCHVYLQLIDRYYCLFRFHGEILVLGFANGKIRLVDVNEDEHYNMSSYWELAMHDNDNGIINQFALSYDKSMLFSCGNDGNVFSFCLTTVQVEMGKKSLVFSFGIVSNVNI